MGHEKRHRFYLSGIMAAVVFFIGSGIIYFFYRNALTEHRRTLAEVLAIRAPLINAVAEFDAQYSAEYPGGAEAATLSQVVKAHENLAEFHATGEFAIGRISGGHIEMIALFPEKTAAPPRRIAMDSSFAEPMRRAVKGETGTVIGLDHRGVLVLAAYQPVGVYGWGLAAKIDIATIQKPYWMAAFSLPFVAIASAFFALRLYSRITSPFLKSLKDAHERLDLAFRGAQDGLWEWADMDKDEEWWSDSFYRLLGYAPGEVEASHTNFKNLLHPGDREKTLRFAGVHFDKKSSFDVEYQLKIKSGEYRWFRGRGQVTWDKSGKPKKMSGLIHDIHAQKTAQLDLLRNQELFHGILDETSAIIYLKDLEGKYFLVNRQFEKFWGIPQKNALGKTDHELFARENADIFVRNDRDVLQAKKVLKFEEVALVGAERRIFIAVKFPLSKDGVVCGLGGISTDITDIKNSQEKLLKFSKIMEQSPVTILITGVSGEIEFANPACYASTGYSPEEVLGRNPRIFGSGGQSREFYKELWDTVLSGKTWRGEFHNKRKNGELYWELAVISPVKDEKNEVINFIAIKEDITSQKEIANDLAGHVRFINAILNNLKDGVIAIDQKGVIQLFNPAAEKMFGYPAAEILGASLQRLMPGALWEKHEAGFGNYLQAGASRIIGKFVEVQGRRKDSSVFPIELGVTQIDQGGDMLFVGLVRDISERKEHAELLKIAQRQILSTEKLAGIGQLAAGVSHEILNPLNIISIHVQMLQRSKAADAELQNALSKMKNEVNRIEKINRALLTFSRKGKAERRKLKIEAELNTVLNLIYKEMELENIRLEKEIFADTPDIEADPDELRQVLLNIITNARHAMPGGGTLTIRTKLININNIRHARITIEDTGCGISKENIQKVFTPFFTTKEEGVGTGLGLSIVHALVEKHGGTVKAESEEGKWTRVEIDLPCDEKRAE